MRAPTGENLVEEQVSTEEIIDRSFIEDEVDRMVPTNEVRVDRTVSTSFNPVTGVLDIIYPPIVVSTGGR